MPYEIYGKTTFQHGKTLWEILGNLKNHGVGRVVIRNQFKRYPEPSWYRILNVETLAPEGKVQVLPPVLDLGEIRRVRALVDSVFRGTYRGREWLYWTTYKPDYSLVPKDEEETFTKVRRGELPPARTAMTVLPSHIPFPPLMKELIIQSMKRQGTFTGDDPKLAVTIVHEYQKIAEEGEKPTITVTPGLDTPVAPRLYENIKKL